jgi:RNA-binding protein
MLTGKQRAQLRALANDLEPIFQVGKGGISEEMCKQLSNALEARELIKLTVLENSGYTAREACDELAAVLGAEQVSVTGRKFVLYRASETKKRENKKRIEI